MTIFYTISSASAKCGFFGSGFANLLFRWRGSIFKLIWPELFIFLIAYYGCALTYWFLLNSHQQRIFEQISNYCEKYRNLIPVSFVLGFYVSLVVSRWWAQYKCIPWIDILASWVNLYIPGSSEKERLYRRTIMRYVCLSITQYLELISPTVKKRFPTLDHYIEAGLLLEDEKNLIVDITTSIPKHEHQIAWIPMIWASNLVIQAKDEDIIKSDTSVWMILNEINKIKELCLQLLNFDRICVPLVYTQVVSLTVYSFFFSCLMGSQRLYSENKLENRGLVDSGIDALGIVIPIFTILQFLFYMGWLKVAECLVTPYGEDDNDFEILWMVDRSLLVSYLLVDDMHQETPTLIKDKYWNELIATEISHTKISVKLQHTPPKSSTDKFRSDSKAEADAEIIQYYRPNIEFNANDIEEVSDGDVEESRRTFARNVRRNFLRNLSQSALKLKLGFLGRLMRRKANYSKNTGTETGSLTGSNNKSQCVSRLRINKN